MIRNVDFDGGGGNVVVTGVVITSIFDTLVQFLKIECHFDRAAQFLGVDLVESIDKRSIFGLETATNR